MVLSLLLACRPAPDDAAPVPSTGDTGPDATFCERNGFGRAVAWDDDAVTGILRHDVAADWVVEEDDGRTWSLRDTWTGCESVVFLPDTLGRSEGDDRPVWSRDLRSLVRTSPRNAHYVLLASDRDRVADAEREVLGALDALDGDERDWWAERLHVPAVPVERLDGWVPDALAGMGALGFAVDRARRLRGLGSLANVERSDPFASWPWENDVTYAAHDVMRFDREAARAAAIEGEAATVIPVWSGEVLSQYAEAVVTLPDAAELATFDTLELEVEMRCPDPALPEPGNCGAWDYLASLSVDDGAGGRIELGRFVTTYHREATWILDASPLLPLLAGGGARRLRWEWAPYWNVQPTSTFLSLRFARRGDGERPATATRLFTGGPFGSTYDDGRAPVEVPIPADTTRAALYVVVTGHGAGAHQCAEFCDHRHRFRVDGGPVHEIGFPEAGTDDGCLQAGIPLQMTPNQWGTWWFGRGGWCPGQPVAPHVIDVTGEVTPGATATVSYEGLFDGAPPVDGSGDIVLESWLVTWSRP